MVPDGDGETLGLYYGYVGMMGCCGSGGTTCTQGPSGACANPDDYDADLVIDESSGIGCGYVSLIAAVSGYDVDDPAICSTCAGEMYYYYFDGAAGIHCCGDGESICQGRTDWPQDGSCDDYSYSYDTGDYYYEKGDYYYGA